MLSISYLGPSYVALVPQVEEVEEGEQTEPPGFHVIYILSIGPSYVALVPQVEEVEEGEQTKPPGFHVVYLPYLDDFRHIPDRRLLTNNPRFKHTYLCSPPLLF